MTRRHRLSRLVDVLLPVGYVGSFAGINLWFILCVQDGYARPSTSHSNAEPHITSDAWPYAGPYPFDVSATAGKTTSLIIFGAASAILLVDLILKGPQPPTLKDRAASENG